MATLLLQNQLPESVALLREVVKAILDYELAYFELGRALLQQEDTTGAIESLEKAKKLAPDHDAVYFQLSQAYRRAGRVQEAGQALAGLPEANRGEQAKEARKLGDGQALTISLLRSSQSLTTRHLRDCL